MAISMSQVQTIRQLKKEGESIAGISHKVGVSRDTVYKYLEKDDFSRHVDHFLELGGEASESTVRHYVARARKEYSPPTSSFLTLVWAPARRRRTST